MSKAITMTENYSLADLLEKNHFAILSQWQGQARVQNVLNAKQISPNFFFKHFGSRVLDYFINILRGKKEPGSCPVIIVMLNFFSKRELLLECSFKSVLESAMRSSIHCMKTVMEVLKSSNDGVLKLFDAVSADMDRYIERFCVENIAMKNSHHIHEPTTLSIRQITTMFAPEQIEDGEIEFF